MVQFINNNQPGLFNTVAASQTTQKLSATQGGTTGTTGDYLEHVTIIPATATPGAVTIFDGLTAIYTIPTGASLQPYFLPIRSYSKSGAWNITTAGSVSVIAVGKFS